MPLYVIFTTLLFFSFASSTSQAQARGKVGPSVGAMVLFGSGQMGNDTDVLERSMIYTPVAVFAGFNYKKLRLGINYEYVLGGQSDDPSSLGNQNISGKGSAAGLRFDYYNGRTSFGAIYHVSQNYTLDKPTVTGATAEYEGKNSYSIQFYTQIKKRFGIVVDYSVGELKSSGDFTDDLKWNRIGVGVIFTNFAGAGRRR